ncbi:MAG: lactate utilization protein, partial [Anaerolineales bacterium]|nr:lactate utilization protein [Anaerolineales bacterium]
MTATLSQFRQQATIAIEDVRLQTALEGATTRFTAARGAALAQLPWADELRDHFKAIRAATLANLADHLETFEHNATAAGARVHWAATAADACRIVTDLAQARGVTLVTKSKSMATEEIHLNQVLS